MVYICSVHFCSFCVSVCVRAKKKGEDFVELFHFCVRKTLHKPLHLHLLTNAMVREALTPQSITITIGFCEFVSASVCVLVQSCYIWCRVCLLEKKVGFFGIELLPLQ